MDSDSITNLKPCVPILQQVTQQQGFTHESHLIPLQDGPSVSHLWWLQIEPVEGCQRRCQKVCCSLAQHCQQESQTRGATLEKIWSTTDEPHSGP